MEREEYVSTRGAAALLGCSPVTLRRRIKAGAVPTFLDPLDFRRWLIKRSDLEILRRPRPMEEKARLTAA